MIPKFRGKSTAEENKGEWVYGNLVFDKDLAIIVSGIDEATCEYIAFEDFCSVDIDTVGQSTGICDKHGVEIFEKDIVKFSIDNGFEYICDEIGFVYYCLGDYRILNRLDETLINTNAYLISDIDKIEVLGNIYENPELMEGNA